MVEGPVARVTAAFAAARREGRTLLLPYLTAALPDAASSVDLFAAMADAGADGFEIGFPYSDPLMDGPTIHAAGLRALEAGASFATCLRVVSQVVERTGLPVIVMTYANPVMTRGADAFANAIAEAGAGGMIVADLPVDEAHRFVGAAEKAGVGLVMFVAPTTDNARLERVIATDPVFIYAVARMGVTGEEVEAESQLEGLAARVRTRTEIPLVAGVGISSPEMAAAAARHADGVIVGSALVRRVLEAENPSAAATSLHEAVTALATAMGPG